MIPVLRNRAGLAAGTGTDELQTIAIAKGLLGYARTKLHNRHTDSLIRMLINTSQCAAAMDQ